MHEIIDCVMHQFSNYLPRAVAKWFARNFTSHQPQCKSRTKS